MNTEVKTLQYRSREKNRKDEGKAKAGFLARMMQNRVLCITASLAVVVAIVASIVTFGNFGEAKHALAYDSGAAVVADAGSEDIGCTSADNSCTGYDTTSVNASADSTYTGHSASDVNTDTDSTYVGTDSINVAEAEGAASTDGMNAAEAENAGDQVLIGESYGSSIDIAYRLFGAAFWTVDEKLEAEALEIAARDDSADAADDGSLILMSESEGPLVTVKEEKTDYASRKALTSVEIVYNEDMRMDVTAEELEILERIVEAEATDQDVYGRMLVANVVINRVNSHYFANSIEKVVFQKIGGDAQFSPISDGRYYTVTVTDKTREAVKRVLAGEDCSQGALYFFQRDMTSANKASWFDRHLKYLFKYGCHEFYTEFK